MSTEFNPGEELTHFPDRELYGLPQRIFFYLLMTCRLIGSFSAPAFSVEPAPAGCFVEFIIRKAFWIDVSRERIKLWAGSADDADVARNRYIVYEALDADDPRAWEGLLGVLASVEKFSLFANHSDRLREMWTQWLVAQQRLSDERGF